MEFQGSVGQGMSPLRSGSKNYGLGKETLSPSRRKEKGFGGSRIKVCVRIRPMLPHEEHQGHTATKLNLRDNKHIEINHADRNNDDSASKMNNTLGGGFNRRKVYSFDQVFTPEDDQDGVYEGLGVRRLIDRVVDGYHGTIFAYGQTGSGKSFTMEGNEREVPDNYTGQVYHGITQRGVKELFEQIETVRQDDQRRHFSVFCSFLQIYNEKVFDLLNPSSVSGLTALRKTHTNLDAQNHAQGLRIRWTKKDQFVVENLYVFECQTYEEALKLFKFGSQNKVLASHNLNEFSSRSHSIFSLTIETQDIKQHMNVTVSRLQLVDLAGSEKQSLTGTSGIHAKESIDINKSLLVLRKVITALTETKGSNDHKFIPYRESKLTQLLKQSLGGNSYTVMMACLSPCDKFIEENISTLNYAARASLISNIPTKNIDPQAIQLHETKGKILELEKELRQANEHVQFLTQLGEEKDQRIQYLENKVRRLQSHSYQQEGLMMQQLEEQKQHYEAKQKQAQQEAQKQQLSRIMGAESEMSAFSKIDDASVMAGNTKLPDIGRGTMSNPGTEMKQNNQGGQGSGGIADIHSPIAVTDSGMPESPTHRSYSPTKTFFSQGQGLGSGARGTMQNFYFKQDKEKMDAAAERLIASVNAVTDLLKANTKLRDQIERAQGDIDEKDAECFQLNIENQALRERLELVEGILKNNSQDYDELVSAQIRSIMEKSNTEYGKFGQGGLLKGVQPKVTTVDEVYTELIQLRNKNRALEGRIKQLENQNFNMTQQNFTDNMKGQASSMLQNRNNEPSRPQFGHQSQQSVNWTSLTSPQADRGAPTYDDTPLQNNIKRHVSVNPTNSSWTGRTGHTDASNFNSPDAHAMQRHHTMVDKSQYDESQFARHKPLLNNQHGYQSETNKNAQLPPRFRQGVRNQQIGMTPHQQMSGGTQVNSGRGGYQPEPDNRFYTKANFFTLRNNSRDAAAISEKYQTEAEPGQQEVYEEMMQRRHRLSKAGAVQAPAVPGDNTAMMFSKNAKSPGIRGNDSALKAMNRTANAGGGEQFPGASSHLHPISELGPQGGTLDASRGYGNDNMIPYPQPMHVRSKMQKSGTKVRDSSSKGGGSMVLVMSNLMTKRKNGGSKRGGKSTKPASDAGMPAGRNYHQNDFY